MKNIFYFILTVLIISCNNNKNNNTTNESITLIDSLQKVNDLILAENLNLKQSLFDTQRNLDNLKSNQVLDSKLSINEEEQEELKEEDEKEETKREKNYSRKEIEKIVSEIRALYDKKNCCREYNVTHFVNPSNRDVRAIGNLQIKIETDQDHNFISLYNMTGPESFKSEFLYLNTCADCDYDYENLDYLYDIVDDDRQLLFYYKKIVGHPTLSAGEIRGYYYNNKLIKAVFSGFQEHYRGIENGTYYPPLEYDICCGSSLDVDVVEQEYKSVNF